MTGRGVVAVLALCALPARGASHSPSELHALTPIDSLPSKADLVKFLDGDDNVGRLRQLAMDQTVDFGVQLRAIRALPQFCSPSCRRMSGNHPAHQALLDILGTVSTTDRSGTTTLRLRAAIEALGETRSGEDSDLNVLVGYLGDSSRDIRATAARALGDLCLVEAKPVLLARYRAEAVSQVQLAISVALRAIDDCE